MSDNINEFSFIEETDKSSSIEFLMFEPKMSLEINDSGISINGEPATIKDLPSFLIVFLDNIDYELSQRMDEIDDSEIISINVSLSAPNNTLSIEEDVMYFNGEMVEVSEGTTIQFKKFVRIALTHPTPDTLS